MLFQEFVSVTQSLLIHVDLLKEEQQPDCKFCDYPLTLHHFF